MPTWSVEMKVSATDEYAKFRQKKPTLGVGKNRQKGVQPAGDV